MIVFISALPYEHIQNQYSLLVWLLRHDQMNDLISLVLREKKISSYSQSWGVIGTYIRVFTGKRTRSMWSGYRTWTMCSRSCRSMWGSTTPLACPGTLGAAMPWRTSMRLHPTVVFLPHHHVRWYSVVMPCQAVPFLYLHIPYYYLRAAPSHTRQYCPFLCHLLLTLKKKKNTPLSLNHVFKHHFALCLVFSSPFDFNNHQFLSVSKLQY